MGFASYLRVSTKRQGKDGLGMESQRAIIAHYYPEIVAEFAEVESGANGPGNGSGKRPGLEEAIRLCEAGGHTLVVAKVDRLSRNTGHTLEIYRRLGGRFRACDLPMVEDDPTMFKFILTIQAALAERERELISIRTKAALKAAKRRGTKLGAPEHLTPEARAKGPASKRQAAAEHYRPLVDYIRLLKEREELSYGKIADRLNAGGHKTREGREFKAMTVYRILKREEKG